ncbi:hypothetical protein ANN_13291 [Periplaneta americana]|uniref:Uncharacterized protein n=1 Tax=Periplaneta americana TaxID=6978 RepID=A0ABQ8TJH1_PERAM|nr:hypothetical protein ANN_13291 [Periplaneta americana]
MRTAVAVRHDHDQDRAGDLLRVPRRGGGRPAPGPTGGRARIPQTRRRLASGCHCGLWQRRRTVPGSPRQRHRLGSQEAGVVSTEHAGASLSYPLKTQCTRVHSVAASGYALCLSLLHDSAHGIAPRTLCTFQRVLMTTALEYVIRKVQNNREGLELNGLHSYLSMRMT